jgi:hypothetical protein
MPGIIALALIAIVALTVLSFTVHVLFSPWLLVAIAILAWINLPARSLVVLPAVLICLPRPAARLNGCGTC